jgi:hypothetical protein
MEPGGWLGVTFRGGGGLGETTRMSRPTYQTLCVCYAMPRLLRDP